MTIMNQRHGGAYEILRANIAITDIIEGSRVGEKVDCVFHEEDNVPDMHVYEDHVHCFACGYHGDVVDVWSKQHSIEAQFEAALDLAKARGIQLPQYSAEQRAAYEARRKAEEANLEEARKMHDSLTKRSTVREWWESRGFDAELRERYLLGAADARTASIPFWSGGRVQGVLRRKLQGDPKYLVPAAEDLPGGHKPLLTFLSNDSGIAFLVEGVIDAVALAACGLDAVAVVGTHMSGEQRAELPDRPFLILPDKDPDGDGEEAARRWARNLYPNARICDADYGKTAEDVAKLFELEGKDGALEQISRLVRDAKDLLDIETAEVAEMEGDARQKLKVATETIIPLLAAIDSESERGAAIDIVKNETKLQKAWIVSAIKEVVGERDAAALQEALHRAELERQRRAEECRQKIADAQPEIDRLFAPGVLKRAREVAARVHNVKRDEKPLELQILIATGAQLAPLGNGRPLGASDLLTAEAGRGKNHLADAAVKVLPEEFFFTFEIASGQSLYYAADEDPDFLKHKFAYPNEIEGVEQLVEFLRPMLSKGWCRKFVTDKDPITGRNMMREIIVEGPVTTTIPTVRNKTDDQLQTRLLIAELPDYKGRVKEHSAGVSELLHPEHGGDDFSKELWLWHEGFKQLTEVRRVVFPLRHPDFALDDDNISHGARLWANLLGLMSAHAWMEQKNRKEVVLATEETAIVAIPEDYEAAYDVFTKVCKRTVVNLSANHRAILTSLYNLEKANLDRDGFSLREIAEGTEAAGRKVSHQTVANNKSFLQMSAKFIKETDDGIALVYGAEPSWWSDKNISVGLPTPEQVKKWWEGPDPSPDGAHIFSGAEGSKSLDTLDSGDSGGESRIDKGNPLSSTPVDNPLDSQDPSVDGHDDGHGEFDATLTVKPFVKEQLDSENPIDKPNGAGSEGVSSLSSDSGNKAASEKRGRVVSARRHKGEYVNYFDEYVGHQEKRGGHDLPESFWANPFMDGPLEERLEKYRMHLRQLLSTEEGRRKLEELRGGKTIACFCPGKNGVPEVLTADDPLLCHGQLILIALEDDDADPEVSVPTTEDEILEGVL